MQQHPIPQNVTAYEFHLIGNMTIKQFIELGVGIGVAVIFFSTGLPGFVKWPLVFFSVIVGAAMAFMPFDGRPLDRMVIIFFRAVYSPTQYIWRKQNKVPRYFNFTRKQAARIDPSELEKQRLRKNINEYLQTLPHSDANQSDLDKQETEFVNSYNQMFESTVAAKQVTPSTGEVITPQTKVRVRKMMPETQIAVKEVNLPQTLKSVSIDVPQPVIPQVPQSQPASVDNQTPETVAVQPQSNLMHRQHHTQGDTTEAVTNRDLPFPAPPDIPNVIVGMVLDTENKIVENAIIEIRDKDGTPIRALKTNQLGQFFSASPLKKGNYEIEVEKPGLKFDIINLKLKNKRVPPLEIKALTHG